MGFDELRLPIRTNKMENSELPILHFESFNYSQGEG
jgi:hypothetical protein